MRNFVIGIDIGGTNIKYGIIDSKGNIIFRKSILTMALEGAEKLIERVKKCINECLEYSMENNITILGVGVGTAGQVDSINGKVVFATENLPGWIGMNIKKRVENSLNLDTFVENDVNAVALAECWIGAGKDLNDFFCLTIGTGIGGAIIIDKKVFRGKNGFAGEVGHMVVDFNGRPCNCGRKGCFEQYASFSALFKYSIKKMMKSYTTGTFRGIDNRPCNLNPKIIFEEARKCNPVALEIVNEYIEYLCAGLLNILYIFNPSAIIIGGGIVSQEDYLFKKINLMIKQKSKFPSVTNSIILPAKLGTYAGIIGSGKLVFHNKHIKT